jgi:hypothetical protein
VASTIYCPRVVYVDHYIDWAVDKTHLRCLTQSRDPWRNFPRTNSKHLHASSSGEWDLNADGNGKEKVGLRVRAWLPRMAMAPGRAAALMLPGRGRFLASCQHPASILPVSRHLQRFAIEKRPPTPGRRHLRSSDWAALRLSAAALPSYLRQRGGNSLVGALLATCISKDCTPERGRPAHPILPLSMEHRLRIF